MIRKEEKTTIPFEIPTTVAPVNPAPVKAHQPEIPIIKEEPKLPEAQIPIKKYYGRKRDGENPSSEDELSYDEDATEKTKYETKLWLLICCFYLKKKTKL